MAAKEDFWTREQTIIAFKLYCEIPFGQAHSRNSKVQEVAKIIGRSSGAVARKLGNFGSLDPELKKRGVKGLGNRSKLDEIIWNEFHEDWNKLAFESVKLIADFKNENIEKEVDIDLQKLPKGTYKLREIKTRVSQDFFRSAVLAAHENTCCITGIKIRELLIASHIVPWRIDEENRTNPTNGLCLNALHDKAFDAGLITVLPDLKILVSKQINEKIKDDSVTNFFTNYNGKKIIIPHKFVPQKEFLEYHYQNIFKK